ncbi:hypothetical protein Tco_1343019 [Tanacetum coccineum]
MPKKQDSVKNNGVSTSKGNINNETSTSCNKGRGNSGDINLVSLRNSFAALNEHVKILRVTVEDVFDETGTFMASNKKENRSGDGNKSLHELWKEYLDDDPYDDDEYNAYDSSEK